MNESIDKEDEVAQALQSKLWLQLWGYARRYPQDLTWIVVFALITAAAEVFYPLITRMVVDSVAAKEPVAALWKYGVYYALTTVVICVSIGGFIRIGGKLKNRISYDIRQDGFANLQALSFSYFNQRPVGWLMARMTADCDRLSCSGCIQYLRVWFFVSCLCWQLPQCILKNTYWLAHVQLPLSTAGSPQTTTNPSTAC